jgi:hypothetical protein
MSILNRISGYKTIVGGVLHAVWFVYYFFFNKEVGSEMQWRGHAIIGTLTTVGIAHKAHKKIKKGGQK